MDNFDTSDSIQVDQNLRPIQQSQPTDSFNTNDSIPVNPEMFQGATTQTTQEPKKQGIENTPLIGDVIKSTVGSEGISGFVASPLQELQGNINANLSTSLENHKGQLMDMTLNLIQQAKQLPPGDPRRVRLFQIAQTNLNSAQEMEGMAQSQYQESMKAPTGEQVAGRALNTATTLTPMAKGIELPVMEGVKSIPAVAGANAALGAGFGAANALNQNASVQDVGSQAAGGAAAGAIGGTVLQSLGAVGDKAATVLKDNLYNSVLAKAMDQKIATKLSSERTISWGDVVQNALQRMTQGKSKLGAQYSEQEMIDAINNIPHNAFTLPEKINTTQLTDEEKRMLIAGSMSTEGADKNVLSRLGSADEIKANELRQSLDQSPYNKNATGLQQVALRSVRDSLRDIIQKQSNTQQEFSILSKMVQASKRKGTLTHAVTGAVAPGVLGAAAGGTVGLFTGNPIQSAQQGATIAEGAHVLNEIAKIPQVSTVLSQLILAGKDMSTPQLKNAIKVGVDNIFTKIINSSQQKSQQQLSQPQ